jgi:hypothetical protein
MFSGEEKKEVLEEELKQKRIKQEMQLYTDDDAFYDSLTQEAHEEYCVPARRFGWKGYDNDY